ncbi:MAG: hypothetical protein EAZ14_10610 [Runella slithyformis]|nr:MAG: hypothetical protein EAZ14_10610 [Runella slithyformis]
MKKLFKCPYFLFVTLIGLSQVSYSQVVLQIKDVNDVFSSSVPPEQSISYYIYCIGASLEGCKVTWSGYKNSRSYVNYGEG